MSNQAVYRDAIQKYGNNFTLNEFNIQAGVEYLDYNFFVSFVRWRQWHGIPIYISSAYRIDDSGAHGAGMAIDCILFKEWMSTAISEQRSWLLATTWPFLGVGIYYDWNYIGLHVDSWDKPDKRPLRWLREENNYYYQSLTNGKFYKGNKESHNIPSNLT